VAGFERMGSMYLRGDRVLKANNSERPTSGLQNIRTLQSSFSFSLLNLR
jgi:hypothetical protein